MGYLPTVFCSLFACAHTLRLGDTDDQTKGLQSQITTKAGCKIHPCSHIQSNVMFSLNTIIIIPQLHRPQISSFGHLVRDQDNLTPSLYRSSQLSQLYCVIRVFSQYPHSLPHPIIRGPFTPQDANPIKYSFPDFQYTTPQLRPPLSNSRVDQTAQDFEGERALYWI